MRAKKVLIADDEEAARRKLRKLLVEFPSCKIVAEAEDGLQAQRLIEEHSPDIVFLDINMPLKSGMEVARSVRHSNFHLVFVTAYDRYAVQAFETQAVDYLLKPVRAQRLRACMEKIFDQVEVVKHYQGRLQENDDAVDSDRRQLGIRHGTATRIVDVGHIAWLESCVGYCRIHLNSTGQEVQGQATLLTDASLTQTHTLLPPDKFLRIHRSTIVNCDHVIRHWSEQRRLYVSLREFGDKAFSVSRGHAAEVRKKWPSL